MTTEQLLEQAQERARKLSKWYGREVAVPKESEPFRFADTGTEVYSCARHGVDFLYGLALGCKLCRIFGPKAAVDENDGCDCGCSEKIGELSKQLLDRDAEIARLRDNARWLREGLRTWG